MLIMIPVSVGELLDKITILMLKYEHSKNDKVKDELDRLTSIAKGHKVLDDNLIKTLYSVNSTLWNVEESLRLMEKEDNFSEEFIELARSVYKANDKRANIKKEVNRLFCSEIIEFKFYT